MRRCANCGRYCLGKCTLWALGATLSFPLEHFAWERAPLLRSLTGWMGL